MENSHSTGGNTAHAEEHSFDTKAIWRTFWILLAITVLELILAVIQSQTGFLPKFLLNGVFGILTLAKAFYIVAEFMHLRHEVKNMIMTIGIPALLFLWFLGAFLWDGDSYRTLRNRYDRHYKEQSTPKKEAGGHGASEPGKLH